MKITIIGLGKLGLPLAVQFASKNNFVVGVDIDFARVNSINLGKAPIDEELDLDWKLKETVSSGHLKAVTDSINAIAEAEIIVITVPLITNERGEPDFSIIDSVTESIGNNIKNGTLVCYETTVPIGTTRNRFGRKIHGLSNLKIGKEIFIVFSPERVLTGRVFGDLRKYPKIVGGLTDNCTQKGVEFYKSVLDFDKRVDLKIDNGVWSLETSEAAEFVKLAETTYRDVNIGLANQFAMHAQELNLDIQQIIDASNSQHYSHIHQPGISVGGHCIPVYPHLYLISDTQASLVKEARVLNKNMPKFFVQRLIDKVGSISGKKVLVLGVSYRPGVKEVAFSGAYDLQKILLSLGASPYFQDPLFTPEEILKLGFEPGVLDADTELLIIHTAHQEFKHLNLSQYSNLKWIVDGRDVLGQGIGLIQA